jgi:D-beta-D-heptose 7-phosphate kinase/D-beta-D-heptose 1-phosphate adenosyltransferase
MLVFTNGCFDLLHAGHKSLLTYCRGLAGRGRLVVAINSDDSVRRLKGPSRPIMSADARAASIAMLNLADQIVVFDEDEPTELIRGVQPSLLVKGSEYFGTIVPGAEFAGHVVFAPMMPGVSTTSIIAAITGETL